jgi:fructuronate reductase
VTAHSTATNRLLRAGSGPPAAPVAVAHLGLGGFFRAHQAVYTGRASDAPSWGIAAFTGRSPDLADRLQEQGGLYTLVERGPVEDNLWVVTSVSRAVPGADVGSWLAVLAAPATRLVTLTVTEAAYLRAETGDVRLDEPRVAADLAALRAGMLDAVRTVPGRLVAGLAARRQADAGPVSVVPCDNLPRNGAAVRRVVTSLADQVDEGLSGWLRESVSFVDTEVDRITPRTTDRDRVLVAERTGVRDDCPVVTEPFSEWVLAGRFLGGRPRWEDGGATFVDDVTPFERRKLWLLNGAHSLLAYAGSQRGHRTVGQAIGDDVCAGWVENWWDEAAPHLELPDSSKRDYRADLLARFSNQRIAHELAVIAADGSQKLPIRVLPVVDAERAAGRVPWAGVRVLAAWLLHLRGAGAPISDPDAGDLTRIAVGPWHAAVPRVLEHLAAGLGSDQSLVDAVSELAQEMAVSA